MDNVDEKQSDTPIDPLPKFFFSKRQGMLNLFSFKKPFRFAFFFFHQFGKFFILLIFDELIDQLGTRVFDVFIINRNFNRQKHSAFYIN